MSVTAAMLTERAEKIGLPITKNAFTGTLENPVPDLPYLVYFIPHILSCGADTVHNLVSEDWQLELYTHSDDEAAARIMEHIENEVLHDVPFEKYTAYIKEEECYQMAYEVKDLLRKVKGVRT